MSSTVHVVRHGEVHNPDKILYGRQPGWRLSDRGQEMARTIGEWSKALDLGALHVSPLQRAQETAAPIAAAHNIAITTDERLIEQQIFLKENHLAWEMGFCDIRQHGSTFGIHGNHHGANHTINKSIACLLQYLQLTRQQTVKMQSVFLISYQFGFCEALLKIDVFCMIPVNANAHLLQSQAFILMTRVLFLDCLTLNQLVIYCPKKINEKSSTLDCSRNCTHRV
jgi:hypothetical protein